MIITDLDNSLLNQEKQITEYTKNIFAKCKENGIIIVFATARPYRSTQILFNSIEPDALICHCGGVVYIKEKTILQNGIEHSIAKSIVQNMSQDFININLGIECNDDFYTNFNTKIYWKNVFHKELNVEKLPLGIIYKIVVGLEEIKNMGLYNKYLTKELYVEKMENKVGLIMNRNASKLNGIKALIKHYDIKIENTISFGDDNADIEMIEKCGIGIAMENGNECIKEKAKYICKDNNEDGIAKWLEENILKKGKPAHNKR